MTAFDPSEKEDTPQELNLDQSLLVKKQTSERSDSSYIEQPSSSDNLSSTDANGFNRGFWITLFILMI